MIVLKMEIDEESQKIIYQKKIENKILMEKYNRLGKKLDKFVKVLK